MKDGIIKIENISFNYPDNEKIIFENFSIELPKGVITFIGQNGTGKSTLLLLAAGLLKPVKGNIKLFGIDTKVFKSEHERQKYVSFIYQNMEFETEDNIGNLLEYVYENSFYLDKKSGFISELTEVFELKNILNKKLQEVSKGEIQRTILAFSFLYGSKAIMMDEPIFALESRQKEKALEYFNHFGKLNNLSIYYSLHDIELSQKYSEYALLFFKNKHPEIGLSKDILTKENIELSYETPYTFLKNSENLFCDYLKGI